LPELAWSLPYWPKNYSSFIPRGLFYKFYDWQPKDAIAEIEQRLNALIIMPAASPKSKFLSQKILRQVETLVKISQAFQFEKKRFNPPRGVTRAKQIEALQEKKQALEIQYQALLSAKTKSQFSQDIQAELDILVLHLQELEKLLSSA
jgi:hypothetical protein